MSLALYHLTSPAEFFFTLKPHLFLTIFLSLGLSTISHVPVLFRVFSSSCISVIHLGRSGLCLASSRLIGLIALISDTAALMACSNWWLDSVSPSICVISSGILIPVDKFALPGLPLAVPISVCISLTYRVGILVLQLWAATSLLVVQLKGVYCHSLLSAVGFIFDFSGIIFGVWWWSWESKVNSHFQLCYLEFLIYFPDHDCLADSFQL